MTEKWKENPYLILGIPQTASEEQIKQAFHAKMKETNGSEIIVAAYSQVRDPIDRRKFRWGSIWSYLRNPPQDVDVNKQVDIAPLIKELAFRTEWELGGEDV